MLISSFRPWGCAAVPNFVRIHFGLCAFMLAWFSQREHAGPVDVYGAPLLVWHVGSRYMCSFQAWQFNAFFTRTFDELTNWQEGLHNGGTGRVT